MENKKVLLAILARDKAATLPLYLECIEKLNYDKKDIVLYIRTNNNSDNTVEILEDFIRKNIGLYHNIFFDSTDVDKEMTTHHEWNADRFTVLGKIRQDSMDATLKWNCDYYFVVDCDNFILPNTLQSLISRDVPIVAPMLLGDQNTYYSNFHYDVDDNGYMADNPMYYDIFSRTERGIFPVKVVHCTYLIAAMYIEDLYYNDESGRHEYVIFSHSARAKKIPQYIDNNNMYGLITFKTEEAEMENINYNNFADIIKTYVGFSDGKLY